MEASIRVSDIPRSVYRTGSVKTLRDKIPADVLKVILDHYELSDDEIKDISFTFYPDSDLAAVGNTRPYKNCDCGHCTPGPLFGINVDIDKIIKVDEPDDPYQVLAHEIGHLADFVKGRFVENDDGSLVYNGKHYTADGDLKRALSPVSKEAFAKYRALPWEVFANENAAIITTKLKEAGIYGDGGRSLKNDEPSKEAVLEIERDLARNPLAGLDALIIDLIRGSKNFDTL